MFFIACFFIIIKLNGEGASHLSIPHPLERFLFKKENDNNVCKLKGASSKRNCIGTSNAKNGDLYHVFLTMEMNEHGYKIKGPH